MSHIKDNDGKLFQSFDLLSKLSVLRALIPSLAVALENSKANWALD